MGIWALLHETNGENSHSIMWIYIGTHTLQVYNFQTDLRIFFFVAVTWKFYQLSEDPKCKSHPQVIELSLEPTKNPFFLYKMLGSDLYWNGGEGRASQVEWVWRRLRGETVAPRGPRAIRPWDIRISLWLALCLYWSALYCEVTKVM